jgi:hypothetical protein
VTTQPEALRLADWLCRIYSDLQTPRRAAAELRRLHAVNAELLEVLKDIAAEPDDAWSVALLNTVRAVIAKAEGVKP